MKTLISILVVYSILNLVYCDNAYSKLQKYDWCKQNCDGAKNTPCERKGCNAVGGCKLLNQDDNFRKWSLKNHNEYRNKVALGEEKQAPGSAANMMINGYDMELEYLAYCHGIQCKYYHDKCRSSEKYEAGQNMVVLNISDYIVPDDLLNEAYTKKLMDRWYNEVIDVDPSNYDSFTNKGKGMIGHYTQIVWAETEYIGCVRTGESSKFPSILIFCNYGPAGNIQTEPMYIKGAPCSQCPSGVKCNSVYKGLCGETPADPKASKSHGTWKKSYNFISIWMISIFWFLISQII